MQQLNTVSSAGSSSKLLMAVLVSALGYFVDVFDIALFSIVRVSSLKDLGLAPDQVLKDGVFLLNTQLIGMLIGGIIWGTLGDKIGRIQVLFGSILLYSIGNIANSFISTVEAYAFCRFFAGIGLAGEVGAGITLVAELSSNHKRGISTAIVAAVGTAGAAAASLVSQLASWRTSYLIGGVLGLLLLLLRVRVCESGLFDSVKRMKHVNRGDIRLLFNPKRFFRYLSCILAGTPLFFCFYVLITFSPELGKALNLKGEVITAIASLYFTIGMTIGDMFCGLLSQYLASRRAALFCFVSSAFVMTMVMFSLKGAQVSLFYSLCFPMGFCIGYWAVYLTSATEQFGTNLRATVTSTVPNFIRVTPVLFNYLFLAMKDSLGVLGSLQLVGLLAFTCSFYFIYTMKETFGVNLNFFETNGGDKLQYEIETPEPGQDFKKAAGWN